MIDLLIRIIDRLIQLKEYRDSRLQELHEKIFQPTFEELMAVHRDYMKLFEETRQRLPSFEFLTFPCIEWLRAYNYVLFDSYDDAKLFCACEGKDANKIGRLRSERNYFIWYTSKNTGRRIRLYFSSGSEATRAAEHAGLGNVFPATTAQMPASILPQMRETERFVRQARLEFEPVRTKLKALTRELGRAKFGKEGDEFIASVLEYFPDGAFDTKQHSSGATTVLGAMKPLLQESENQLGPHRLKKIESDVHHLLYSLEEDYKEKWNRVSDTYAAMRALLVTRF
jgi:hypothetical protein